MSDDEAARFVGLTIAQLAEVDADIVWVTTNVNNADIKAKTLLALNNYRAALMSNAAAQLNRLPDPP